VHLKSVTEIATEGETAAVEGLQPGDVVATSGFDKIQDGTRVAVLSSQTTPNANPGNSANGAHIQ